MDIHNQEYKTQFIPNDVVSFVTNKEILTNDIFTKYQATAVIHGEIIIAKDTETKLTKKKTNRLIKDTYQDYLKFIETYNTNKDKWIYNIIDGISEQQNILYRDDKCIVIPTYVWDAVNLNKLHILCIPTDTTLRCIRSLTNKHIPLITHMKKQTIKIINQLYKLNEANLKIYFHYIPSTYHLHIHFVNTEYIDAGSSVEYSHSINNVLFNLEICPTYYQQIVLHIL